MKVSSTRNADLFYVDWWLHNHNRHRASYEHELLHCGNIDLPYLKDCKRFIDQVTVFAAKSNKQAHVNFTGGEVTEWVDFPDLLAYAKSQSCLTRFTSNTICDLQILNQCFSLADSVGIEVHPEYASISHILIVLRLLSIMPCSVNININMMPERWKEMEELYETIQVKYPYVSVSKKMLFDDPIFNTTPQNYSEEQIIAFKAQTGDIKIEHDNDIEYTDFQSLVIEQKNKFKGFLCYAGVEQIIVDAWGRAHRGHCRKNGFMGSISDAELFWYNDPLICQVDACVNNFDILSTKKSFE